MCFELNPKFGIRRNFDNHLYFVYSFDVSPNYLCNNLILFKIINQTIDWFIAFLKLVCDNSFVPLFPSPNTPNITTQSSFKNPLWESRSPSNSDDLIIDEVILWTSLHFHTFWEDEKLIMSEVKCLQFSIFENWKIEWAWIGQRLPQWQCHCSLRLASISMAQYSKVDFQTNLISIEQFNIFNYQKVETDHIWI